MITESELDGILREVRPTATVTETTPLDRGNRKQTTIVRFADAAPVVVQRSADRDAIRTEARLLDAIADRTSIPVARPLATGANGWLVTPFVVGTDLHEQFTDLASADRQRIVEQFGRSLAQLHEAFEFEAYGPVVAGRNGIQTGQANGGRIAGGIELVPNGGDPPAPTADWPEWLRTVGEAAIGRLPSEFDDLRPKLRAAVAEGTDSSPTPRLFPWDFRPGNALLDGGELAAIVDWEGPLAADPALSYAKAEYLVADWYVSREQARELRSVFRRGYESIRDPPAIEPAHRVAAIASTAVDSRGVVTNPRYPPVDREPAIEFHRESLRRALSESS
ncbi:phosphotransferase family protein [Halovenus sp. HT40]|uniref:phosphotransferase family protein n=1 Tax=Halovenus sp. HT40 TaxID=3126691 RepID=UPI00300E7E25